MIFGLVSYPRSGNTLLRLYLAKVFEIDTMSIHDSYDSGSLHIEIGNEIRHVKLPQEYDQSRNYYIKSHNIEHNMYDKLIYVVRDGRCACISYYHHLNDNGRKTSYDEVFNGVVYRSWSYHLNAYAQIIRSTSDKHKLLLRYEDMVSDPNSIIAKLSDFCGLTPRKRWINEFNRLHGINPQFFRKGNNLASIQEFELLEEKSKNLFWKLHSNWMSELNYY